MPTINFTDNNALIIGNPNRGMVMQPKNLWNRINATGYLDDDSDLVWFDDPVYLNKPGEVIRWYKNGIEMGSGLILEGRTHNQNLRIQYPPLTGRYQEADDLVLNFMDKPDMFYFGIGWEELEPTKGVYDWATLEAKMEYAFAQANGLKYVLRFVMDSPDQGEGGHTLPAWLQAELAGDFIAYDNSNGTGLSPNYNNALLLSYHKSRLQAIKDHFGNNIALVELGSLGHWGEWHTYGTTFGNPTLASVNSYIQDYYDVFGTDIPMNIRRPVNKAAELNIGIYYDMFGANDDLYASWGLLNNIANGYTDNWGLTHNAYPTFKEKAPITGELAPWAYNMGPENDFRNNATPRHYTLLRQSAIDMELSSIGLHPNYDLFLISGLVNSTNFAEFKRKIGYRLLPTTLTYSESNGNLDISITIQNNGWARAHKNYPVYVNFYDTNDNFMGRSNLNINVKTILPGTSQTFSRSISYPTSQKIAIELEGIQMPITTNVLSNYVYFLDNVSLVANVSPIPLAQLNVGDSEIPLFNKDDPNLNNNNLRICVEVGTNLSFDLLDPEDPNSSDIYIQTHIDKLGIRGGV